jgi:hypothetical protein
VCGAWPELSPTSKAKSVRRTGRTVGLVLWMVAVLVGLIGYNYYCWHLHGDSSIGMETASWTPTEIQALTATCALFHAAAFVLFYSSKKNNPMLP